jgi:glycosyltransferase involved in cell wall biosynthesis
LPTATPDGGHVLVVGALRKYKGGETVVEALAALDPTSRPRVVFAGPDEGYGSALMRTIREAGLQNFVELRGWVSDEELERLYGEAIATVNPSTYEGYGLAVGESLARGLPTVASDIPPHLEIGRDALLTFAAGDAQALAVVLQGLRDSRHRHELARRALARSHELAAKGPTWRDVILQAVSSHNGAGA